MLMKTNRPKCFGFRASSSFGDDGDHFYPSGFGSRFDGSRLSSHYSLEIDFSIRPVNVFLPQPASLIWSATCIPHKIEEWPVPTGDKLENTILLLSIDPSDSGLLDTHNGEIGGFPFEVVEKKSSKL